MDSFSIVLLVLVVAAVVVALVAVNAARRRTALRDRFGPEYERAVAARGNRNEAEADLRARLDAHERLELRDLTEDEQVAYQQRWDQVQAEFVDQPTQALAGADRLVTDLLVDRGYPADGFDEQAALVSVDRPDVVADYREAHRLLERRDDGEVSTEDRRQALVSYRAVFDGLVGAAVSRSDGTADRHPEEERAR